MAPPPRLVARHPSSTSERARADRSRRAIRITQTPLPRQHQRREAKQRPNDLQRQAAVVTEVKRFAQQQNLQIPSGVDGLLPAPDWWRR